METVWSAPACSSTILTYAQFSLIGPRMWYLKPNIRCRNLSGRRSKATYAQSYGDTTRHAARK